MSRHLDLASLRSFTAVAETGGVTRAAQVVNLTQSAVSMQMKRMEEALGLSLFDRSGRGVALTREGEQLLSYARRLLALNDEALGRLTAPDWEGTVTLGVPHDLTQGPLLQALRDFARACPRVGVSVVSDHSRGLKALFAAGEVDLILTTELELGREAELLERAPLRWFGAHDGQVWRERPLRLAFCRSCVFRTPATAALDAAGLPWSSALDTESDHAMEAVVAADLGICALLRATNPDLIAELPQDAGLPRLPEIAIGLYVTRGDKARLAQCLADAIRGNWRRERIAA